MRAVVTAGGTAEPIDDVRVVTNLSTGRFGTALAQALAGRGVDVTVLAGKVLADRPGALAPPFRVVPFATAADLDRAIDRVLAEGPDDLFLMAAAVSDWAPVPYNGKLASGPDELLLRLRPVPKILPTLRARCGDRTVLVGFKLLSGVEPDVLIDAARRQIREAHVDLCVANDLRALGAHHPVWIVTPDGRADLRDGTTEEVAEAVVASLLRSLR